jgi:hypothetical protein
MSTTSLKNSRARWVNMIFRPGGNQILDEYHTSNRCTLPVFYAPAASQTRRAERTLTSATVAGIKQQAHDLVVAG